MRGGARQSSRAAATSARPRTWSQSIATRQEIGRIGYTRPLRRGKRASRGDVLRCVPKPYVPHAKRAIPTVPRPASSPLSVTMIDVANLVKDYGTVVAVNGVSFHVGRGEVVGFLGPNGAGKSTTLRILSGFLGPTSGRVRIDGRDVLEEGILARRSIGYMPEAAPLYPEMRVREYLRFRAELKGVARKNRVSAVG